MVSEKRQRTLYIAGDFLATSLAWFVFNIIRYFQVVEPSSYWQPSLTAFLSIPTVILGQAIFPLIMMATYVLSGYYNKVFFRSRLEELLSTLSTAAIGALIIFFIAIINDDIPDRASNIELLLMLLGLLFIFVYCSRLTITQHAANKIKRKEWKFNTLIIGNSKYARQLCQRLSEATKPSGYNIIGYVDPSFGEATPSDIADLPVYTLDQLPEICKRHNVKNLIVTSHRNGFQSTLDVINRLFPLGLPILISPTLFHLITSKQKMRDIAGEPLIDISSGNMSQSTVNLKRAGDIVISIFAILLLSPVFAAIALAIKKDSDGPVFYRQERIGYHKRPFNILKFRTMYIDAEARGPRLSSTDDPRITRVGRILRKYRFDELPQFWNVLIGEMSLVGPRPEREFYIRQIMERAPYYTLIHQVRPGITSWGMVKHGYASNIDEMIERLQYDLIYIDNVSLPVDLKILFYTVNTVVTGKGI